MPEATIVPGQNGIPELIITPSGNIVAMGFADGAIFLLFPAGKLYRYTGDVIPDHWAKLQTAASKGGYFQAYIRRDPAVHTEYVGRVLDPVVKPESSKHENGDGV